MTAPAPAVPRLRGPRPQEMTPAQRAVHDAIAAGPRGAVQGPLAIWLTSPEMAARAQALGQYARFDSSLPPHLSELAILVTARIWSSGFEWTHHAPLARAVGVAEETVAAIAAARRPPGLDPAAAATFDVAVELHRDRTLSDATYAAAEAALGPQGLVDLVAICGYYTLISMTINAFAVPPGDGPALPPTDLAPDRMFR